MQDSSGVHSAINNVSEQAVEKQQMASTNTALAETGGHDVMSMDMENSDNNQYLTFRLNGETYGVDILRVQEIKGWTELTNIPNTPEYVRGVLNLRGTVVPIIDMRARFKLEQIDYTPTTVVIVLSVKNNKGDYSLVGIVVDAVSDVMNVDVKEIKPTPDFGNGIETEFLNGLATVNDEMVMLMDVDLLLKVDEIMPQEALEHADSNTSE